MRSLLRVIGVVGIVALVWPKGLVFGDVGAKRVVEVTAADHWTEADITVEAGKCYKVTAKGDWSSGDGKSYGPEGMAAGVPNGVLGVPYTVSEADRKSSYLDALPRESLIGRFKSEKWSFFVGQEITFVAPEPGKISFQMNESGSAASRQGKMQVDIEEADPTIVGDKGSVEVVGLIDAEDLLHLTHEGIFWESGGSGSKVGKHGGTFPTLVNGVCWWPKWDGNKTAVLPLKQLWPGKGIVLSLESVEAKRGEVVVEHSSASELVLRFKDHGNGASVVGCHIARKTEAQKALAGGKSGNVVNVDVPSAKPSSPEDVSLSSHYSSSSVERPEFLNTPKALVKSLTSVTSMMVTISNDGDATGLTSDIIATVNPASRRMDKAGVGFARPDGDVDMKTAFEEAVRAVTMRYPLWQPGHIDISFGEKSVAHGGPSAGTAFALLMLSTLEGFELDPSCAVTGDITVDWKVRKVGGVTAKLHGATLDHCLYAAIPGGNELAFADMALLYGNAALWNIHVFSIGTLQDAVAIARTDRAPDMKQAMELFADLQTKLNAPGASALHSAETKGTLKHILELAPNDLSAKYLLALADGTASRTLSLNATYYRLSVIYYPFRTIIFGKKHLDRSVLPAFVTASGRKRLAELRPIAEKSLLPLVADISNLIDAMDAFAQDQKSATNLLDRAGKLDEGFAKLSDDHALIEKLVHEGY